MTEHDLLTACTVAFGNLEAAIVARDAAVVAARRQGLPLRMIANAAGISHTSVVNICQRADNDD